MVFGLPLRGVHMISIYTLGCRNTGKLVYYVEKGSMQAVQTKKRRV